MTHKYEASNTLLFTPDVTPKKRERLHFSDFVVRNITPDEKRCEYFFEGYDGFGIRITPFGTKTFIYMYHLQGQPTQRYTIGQYPRVSLAEARIDYLEAYKKVQHGIDPNGEKKAKKMKEKAALAVKELLPKYMVRCQKNGEKEWKEKEKTIERHAIPVIGDMKVLDVTFKDISPIIDKLYTEEEKQSTARHLLSHLKMMFKYAKLGLGIIEVNPCADLEVPTAKPKRPPRALSPKEIYLFWNNVEKIKSDRVLKMALKFMLCTLQRGADVRQMEWSDVDLNERIWTVPDHKEKNGQEHLIPLSDRAISILKEIKGITSHSNFVFGYNRVWKVNPDARPTLRPFGKTAFNQTNRRCFDVYEIEEYFSPHSLRKTGVTSLTTIKFPKAIVKKIVNHISNDVTDHYDLYEYYEEKRAGIKCFDYILDRILSCQNVDDVPSIMTLRREFSAKGLINKFMDDEQYIPSESSPDSMKGFQTTLLSPVSYTLSASLNV